MCLSALETSRECGIQGEGVSEPEGSSRKLAAEIGVTGDGFDAGIAGDETRQSSIAVGSEVNVWEGGMYRFARRLP